MPPRNPSTRAALTFWSRGGLTRTDTALAQPRRAARGRLPLDPDGRYYAGRLRCPAAGTLVLTLTSPRPLRVFIAGRLALDEGLHWRLFQREVRAVILWPCEAGEVEFEIEVGPRPRHAEIVDSDSPSRNRARTLAAIAQAHPDAITAEAHVAGGQSLPPMSLRFEPAQFQRDGVTYQWLHARLWPDLAQPPSTEAWSPAESPAQLPSLSTTVDPGACIEDTPEDERRLGRRRLFAPVVAAGEALPPLRDIGPDPRPEPALEIATTTTLTIEGPAGAIRVPMPVYERLGRHAPRREFKPTPWPAATELRARVPQPILPEPLRHLVDLYHAAWEMLLRLARPARPESGLPNDYISTGAGFRHYQFVWDTSFAAMCTAYAPRVLDPYASLNVLYSRQFDGGYIHREHDVRDGLPALYEPDFSPNPPLMSVAEWAIAGVTGDAHRLRRVYPALKGYHAWLRHNRRLADGTYWTTGLANGLDNSPSLGEGYPDLTAQMAHDAEMLAAIAGHIGLPDEAAAFRRERDEIAAACNAHLWSEALQIYSTSQPGGGHNPNKVVTAFWPLWAGIVPPARAQALARHLTDPGSFWTHHPIPSLAADSPHFVPEGQYWLGSTWAPTNYAAIKGFARAGMRDLAGQAALRHLQCVWEVWRDTGQIWENYSPTASKRGSWAGPDYCWSALGPIALLIEVVIGLEADALNRRLRWRLREDVLGRQRIGVRNFPLGAATVDVVYGRGPDGAWGIDVDADRPFTLEVEVAGRVRDFACAAGHSRVTVS